MNLWIRSQDKKELRSNPKLGIENDYYIVDRYNIDRAIILGQYATEERALKVLDEIEERIMIINTISLVKDSVSLIAYKNALSEEKIKGIGYPYQMPKE